MTGTELVRMARLALAKVFALLCNFRALSRNPRSVIQPRSYALALGVALSLALLQGQTCDRGNTDLTSLELEVDGGPNLIVGFNTANRSYDVATSGSTVTVRAQAVFGVNDVSWQWLVGTTTIGSGPIGTGSGEVTIPIPIPDGESLLRVVVKSNQVGTTASGYYAINIAKVTDAVTKTIPMTCGNDLGIIGVPGPSEFELAVEPLSEISAGQPFDAQITGYAGLPEVSLDATGGLADLVPLRVAIVGGSVPVVIRSGASDAGVSLLSAPVPGSYTCAVDANGNFGPGAGPFPSCDPANDDPFLQDPGTGLYANYDCVGFGGMIDPLNPCAPFVELTIIDGVGDACAACTALSATKGQVCQNQLAIDPMNAYCSTIDKGSFPLTTETGSYEPDTGAEVLFGFSPYVDWYELGFGGFPVNFPAPGAGLQILVAYGGFTTTGLFPIQIECVMGIDGTGPLPDSALVSISRTPSWIGAEQVSSAPGWQGQELLEASPNDAMDARVAVTPSGDAIAVWAQAADVYANRLISGAWSGPEQIHAGAGLVTDPKVHVADNGDAVVVWEELTSPNSVVYGVLLTSGSWGLPQTLGQPGGGNKRVPQVAVGPTGDAVVVWQRADGPINEITAVRLTAGTWSGPEPMGDSDSYQDGPQVALASNGDALVVWEQFNSGVDWDIRGRRLTAGVWESPVELDYTLELNGAYRPDPDCSECNTFGDAQAFYCSDGANDGCFYVNSRAPQVAVEPNGEFVVVWEQSATEVYAIRVGSVAQGPAELISTGASGVLNPQVEVGPGGDAVAIWEQDDGTAASIYASPRTAGAWGPPVPLETDNAPAQDPQVAVDSTGDAFAVWTQDVGTTTNIYRSRLTSGVWGVPDLVEAGTGLASDPDVAVDTNGDAVIVWEQIGAAATDVYANRFNDLGDARDPRVAVDPNGKAVVVWGQFDGSADNIYANRLTSGAWQVPALLETEAGDAYNSKVAVDPNGNALAVWAQFDGGLYGLYAKRLTSGIWGSSEFLWSGAFLPFDPKVAFGANGDAVVVWGQDDLAEDNIYANRLTSGVWSGAEQLELTIIDGSGDGCAACITAGEGAACAADGYCAVDAGQSVFHPQVGVAANGDAVVVWEQFDGIYANRLFAGVWEGQELVGTAIGQVFDPQVAVEPNGDAVAAWVQFDGSVYTVYANRLTTGAWDVPEPVWTGADLPFDNHVAVADSGDAVLVWVRDDGGTSDIYANRLTTGVWGPPVPLETNPGLASAPRVAVDSNGNAVVVWEQDDGIVTSIYANRLTNGVWDGPELLEEDPGDASAPQVSVDPNGNAVVVWEQDDGTTTNIYANWFSTGAQCIDSGQCDDSPVDCLEPSQCSAGACQPRQVYPDGTPCSVGECQGGVCIFI